MLVLLESLSPEQRAVLLLHDVFDYPYAEIAAIVGQERGQRAAARDTRKKACPAAPAPIPNFARAARRASRRFFPAAEQGDLAGLEALLAARRQADRRRRRQGPGARAVHARA